MNKKSFGISVGSSSILMIFVILCLVSFASLSIVSANADHHLSEKIATRTTAYYEACNKAEQSLASIHDTLVEKITSGLSEEEFYEEVGHTMSFAIPISDLQSLQVEIEFQYPLVPDDFCYKITTWKTITTGTLEYDESLNVIQDPILP